MNQRSSDEIQKEYQAAAAALGQATYHKAKLEGQIAQLVSRMAALEDEHAALPMPGAEVPSAPGKAAKRRAAAMAKAEAVRAKRGKAK
jgi:hypothetical protein